MLTSVPPKILYRPWQLPPTCSDRSLGATIIGCGCSFGLLRQSGSKSYQLRPPPPHIWNCATSHYLHWLEPVFSFARIIAVGPGSLHCLLHTAVRGSLFEKASQILCPLCSEFQWLLRPVIVGALNRLLLFQVTDSDLAELESCCSSALQARSHLRVLALGCSLYLEESPRLCRSPAPSPRLFSHDTWSQ